MEIHVFKEDNKFTLKNAWNSGEGREVSFADNFNGILYTSSTKKEVTFNGNSFPIVDDVISIDGVDMPQLVLESNPHIPFEKIDKIGIAFSDNDFWETWENTLEVLAKSFLYRGTGSKNSIFPQLTRQRLTKQINKGVGGIYCLAQGMVDRGKQEERFNPHEYLKITPSDVFINGEIEQYLTQAGYDQNREFFIVDIDHKKHNFELISY